MQHGDSYEVAFRELLELAPEAVVLSDAAFRVVDANTAACRMYGYDRDTLLHMSIHDIVVPEEASSFVRDFPLLPGRIHVGEWHVRRSDATLVPVEASIKVLHDGRTMSFIRDISERKRAEGEREELVARLRAVFEQCPVGLALFPGPAGGQVEINNRLREWLGIDDEFEPSMLDAMRRSVRRADGHLLEHEQLPSVRALRGERVVRADALVRNALGVITHFSVDAAPITDRDGGILGAVVSVEDVTAEKELERLRAEWSSIVAHDLRQPLVSVSLNAQLVARLAESPAVLKSVERIRTATDRLKRMVGDLMDLSRLEANRLELQRSHVNLVALVNSAAEQARLQTPERPFEVRTRGVVPHVYADPDRVAQVLENLLTNAVKYGDAGTPVVMDVADGTGHVTVEVTNQGRPLAREEIERLFHRFQRTESAKLQRIQGVGLGLYITRSLIEAHGGRITVESIPSGATTFRFTLPAANA